MEELLADLLEVATEAPTVTDVRKVARVQAEQLAADAILEDRIEELKAAIDTELTRQRSQQRSQRRSDRLEVYAAVAAQRAVQRMLDDEEHAALLLLASH